MSKREHVDLYTANRMSVLLGALSTRSPMETGWWRPSEHPNGFVDQAFGGALAHGTVVWNLERLGDTSSISSFLSLLTEVLNKRWYPNLKSLADIPIGRFLDSFNRPFLHKMRWEASNPASTSVL